MKSIDERSSTSPHIDRSFWAGVAVIALGVLLAYSSVFSAGFIWDDDSYITENPLLATLSGLFKIWFSPGATPQYYPMIFSVFWLEYHLWGLNPAGYHLVNISIHILNALLVWVVLRRFNLTWAFWAAFIFAVHPVHVETVAWITELKNVLSLFFYMLALLAYDRFLNMPVDGRQSPWTPRGYYVLAFSCFVLALLSKTVTSTLPAVILLLIWWREGRITWKDATRLAPFFLVGVAMGLFTAKLEVTHVFARGPEWAFSLLERVLIAGRAVWFYAGKLVWPSPLIFSYPRWDIDAGQWVQYLFPLGIFGVVGVLWGLRGTIGRGPLTALLFFMGTLFPALCFFNIYPMRYSFVADHFQYAASLGIICLFCASSELLFRTFRPGTRMPEVGYYGGVLIGLCLMTWHQGKAYENNMVLFADVVEKNPTSWLGYTNRAMEYMDRGQYDLATADMERALRINPYKSEAFSNRAVLRQLGGDYQGALADFSTALALDPKRVNVLLNRSDLYLLLKQYDLALKDCNEALKIKNDFVAGYLHRAKVYGVLGDNNKRLEDFSRVLRIDPENLDALADRGLMYYQLNKYGEAVKDLSAALEIHPGSGALYYIRGLSFAAAGERDKALADLQHARSLGYTIAEDEVRKALDGKTK